MVRVTDQAGNPVTNATVVIQAPFTGTMGHLGNGVYGSAGGSGCYIGPASSVDVNVTVQASLTGYTTASVSANTSSNPPSAVCP